MVPRIRECHPLGKTMPNFWKIAPGEGANHWQMCHQKGCILLGWLELIDYSKFTDKDEILKALGGEQGAGKGAARSIWSFAQEIQPSDVVIANKGTSSVVGIGVVRSEYLPPKSPKNPGQSKWLPHARLVDWLVDQPIDFDHRIFALSTVHLVKPETCDEIKQAYLKKYPELKDKLDQLFPSEPDEDGVLE